MLEMLTMSCFFKKDFYLYIAFITKEIVSSSIHVLKSGLVLRKFDDEIIQITLPKNISTYRILLIVISITITPGTSVIGVDGNKLTVHCLTKSTKTSLQEMTFINKVLSLKF
jgi:multisubunit Na+/H+ antiporter MnhE subunit